MKINQSQVDQLYLFTRQHFVEYYDLQTELVDHLANAIEAQWQLTPSRTFDEALQIEFKKFGVFGFSDVVQKRHVALEKKYRKIVWGHFKTFFQLPQIIGTFSAVGILFLMLKMSSNSILIFSILLGLVVIYYFFELFRNVRIRNRTNKDRPRKWLFKEILTGYRQSAGLVFLPLQILVHFRTIFDNDYILFLGSFLLISLALYQYIVSIIIPNKAEQYLIETYPEYEFSK